MIKHCVTVKIDRYMLRSVSLIQVTLDKRENLEFSSALANRLLLEIFTLTFSKTRFSNKLHLGRLNLQGQLVTALINCMIVQISVKGPFLAVKSL